MIFVPILRARNTKCLVLCYILYDVTHFLSGFQFEAFYFQFEAFSAVLHINLIAFWNGVLIYFPAPWVPSQATTLIDKELEYRERERVEKREQERERERLREKEAELKLRNTPTHWGSKGGSELAKSDLHSMHLDASRLSQPEPVMRCVS